MIRNKSKSVEVFWQTQREKLAIKAQSYSASTFADPQFATYHDELLELVSLGKKRATAHLQIDFEINRITRRVAGDFWVVLDTSLSPRYLIRITDVDVRPFCEVKQEFAQREGEGDSSLKYWADVHRDYFQLQCNAWGRVWDESALTVCEGFELLAAADCL